MEAAGVNQGPEGRHPLAMRDKMNLKLRRSGMVAVCKADAAPPGLDSGWDGGSTKIPLLAELKMAPRQSHRAAPALQGRNRTAQGNALGFGARTNLSPEPNPCSWRMGAHASGVWFPASRRKLRESIFPARNGGGKDGGTKSWPGRPGRHAGRVRSPSNGMSSAERAAQG